MCLCGIARSRLRIKFLLGPLMKTRKPENNQTSHQKAAKQNPYEVPLRIFSYGRLVTQRTLKAGGLTVIILASRDRIMLVSQLLLALFFLCPSLFASRWLDCKLFNAVKSFIAWGGGELSELITDSEPVAKQDR